MLGPTLDYLVLRVLAHRRNLRSERELDDDCGEAFVPADATRKLSKLQARLRSALPISPESSYLDVGCGLGALALALRAAGCRDVTGVDLAARHIAEARRRAAALGDREVEFHCADIHDWRCGRRYDVVLSHEALEHIDDVPHFLERCRELTRDGGLLVLAFGPLFHSPFGDHMDGFFRWNIPWRGALFNERALLRVRRECYRPTAAPQSYRDAGLNQLRFSEFLAFARATGWAFRFLDVNPQLRRLPLAHGASNALLRVPRVRDYVATSVYAVLERAQRAA
jgi:SAM-dependent methyltransferase